MHQSCIPTEYQCTHIYSICAPNLCQIAYLLRTPDLAVPTPRPPYGGSSARAFVKLAIILQLLIDSRSHLRLRIIVFCTVIPRMSCGCSCRHAVAAPCRCYNHWCAGMPTRVSDTCSPRRVNDVIVPAYHIISSVGWSRILGCCEDVDYAGWCSVHIPYVYLPVFAPRIDIS
jgi:hypothetical protein